ncbi:MAG: MFS transporter [Gammaproteobacteria bacterium]|nr:MFS transporter [Gammaproteobacteria bacterium]
MTPARTPATQPIFHGWWIVLASGIGLSTNPGQFAYGALGLFIVPLGQEYGWDRAAISLALTLFTGTVAVSLPLIGAAVDRFGSRRILLGSTILFGLLLLGIGVLVHTLWQLWLMFALIGSLAAGANALPYLRIIGAWFDRRRGLAFGLAMAGGGLGYTYVPPLLQYVIGQHGWRAGYFVLGGIVLAVAVPIIAFVLRDTPAELGLAPDGEGAAGDADPARPPSASGATRAQALRLPRFWLLFAAFFAVSFSLYGLLAHLVPMLTDRGMPTGHAVLAASTLGVSIIASRIIIGYLIDRCFAPYVALACFVGSAAGLALLGAGAAGALAFFAAVLIGLSIGAEIDLLAFLTSRYFGLRAFGEIYGLQFAAFLLGTALGPLAYGAGFDVAGSYEPVLGAAAGLMLAAAGIMACLPPYARTG